MICSLRGFPKLEMLALDQLSIEKWIVKEKAMPSIKSVQLIDMSDLKTLPDQVGVLKREWFLKEERSAASETGRKPGNYIFNSILEVGDLFVYMIHILCCVNGSR